MSDARKVFTTTEVAKMLDITTSYLVRLVKEFDFDESAVRKAGKGSYLFSEEAVKILKGR